MNPHEELRASPSRVMSKVDFLIEKFNIENHPLPEKFRSETYLVPLTAIEMGLVKTLLEKFNRS